MLRPPPAPLAAGKPAAPSRGRRAVIALLVLAGVWLLGQAGYIHAKAMLAQVLMERAFAAAEGGEAAKPWPWADMRPVARLAAPGLGASALVTSGASGEGLAFGPGLLAAADGVSGWTVVSGHNDTHFSFLKDVRPGDELTLQVPGGPVQRYIVESGMIADARSFRLRRGPDRRLVLTTCWPFGGVAGTNQRLIIFAAPMEKDETA